MARHWFLTVSSKGYPAGGSMYVHGTSDDGRSFGEFCPVSADAFAEGFKCAAIFRGDTVEIRNE